MKYSLEALGRRVIIIPDAKEDTLADGLLTIPSAFRDKSDFATVVSVGEEVPKDSKLQPGDRVLYAKHAGTEFELDGKKHLIIRYEDAFSRLEVKNVVKYKMEDE